MKGKFFFPKVYGLGAEPNFNINHKIIMEINL